MAFTVLMCVLSFLFGAAIVIFANNEDVRGYGICARKTIGIIRRQLSKGRHIQHILDDFDEILDEDGVPRET